MKKGRPMPKDESGYSPLVPTFTVQLDARTIITLRRRSSFEKWKEKYPQAKLISA